MVLYPFIKTDVWRYNPGGTTGKELRFNPWVGKIPWRRVWQPIPEFLPGKSHGQDGQAGYCPWGGKRAGHDLTTK